MTVPSPAYEQAMQTAVGFHSSGRLHEATEAYRQVLTLAPGDVAALANLGTCFGALGKMHDAERCFREALAADADNPVVLMALGICLGALNRPTDAEDCLQRVLAVQPDNLNARLNLGLTQLQQGRPLDAEGSLRQVLAQQPELPQALTNLAASLSAQGRHDEAIPLLLRAQSHDPNSYQVHRDLATAYQALTRLDQAVAHARRAAELRPDQSAAHAYLAAVLEHAGDPAGAEASYRAAIACGGGPLLEWHLARVQEVVPVSLEAMLARRRQVEVAVDRLLERDFRIEQPESEIGTANFFLAYHGLNDRDLQAKIARLYLKACPSLGWVAPHCQPGAARPERNRLRIGFVSAYLRHHTIAKFYQRMIERLPRDQFEVVVCQLDKADAVQEAIANSADIALRLHGTLDAMRNQIAELELDIVMYPEVGMDLTTYLLAFARLAPVQCVSWGHPVTTGVPNVDYFLSSALIEPAGAESHYSETLVQLKTLPSLYQRPKMADGPVDRSRFGFAPETHLYVCPQALFKLHPLFDETLVQLLRQDPLGEVVFVEGWSASWSKTLRRRLEQVGPDVIDRVRFVPYQPEAAFLDLLRTADVLLDSPWFGGGNTTYEAFAMGVPIVTWPGPYMRGRVTAGCYRQMGIEACIARDLDDYVAIAVRLATDPAWRRQIGERLRERSEALFENQQTLAELTAFFVATDQASRMGRRLGEG